MLITKLWPFRIDSEGP